MTITIEIPPKLERQLRQEVPRGGIRAGGYIVEAVARAPGADTTRRRHRYAFARGSASALENQPWRISHGVERYHERVAGRKAETT